MKSREYFRIRAIVQKLVNQLLPYASDTEHPVVGILKEANKFIEIGKVEEQAKQEQAKPVETQQPEPSTPAPVPVSSSKREKLEEELKQLEEKINKQKEKINALMNSEQVKGEKNVKRQISTSKRWLSIYEKDWAKIDSHIKDLQV